ncbi:DNA-directed RNA polymerase I subunit RPA12-like [Impatiens glandulifera]|uniref:DNA-directed RNA polymerase I subunit RPA12-like n=1 Tax=Impatiens glandulifera TaxID=253017 RepID=UPI001FB0A821|nr:DNA-directed RNA polymerase I subunit RPA12-like [Impatiens glandulifera]
MAYCRQRDFMFCEMCGTMLSFNTVKYARCPLCKFKRNLKEISGKEIRYSISVADIRRELGISTLEIHEEQKQQIDYSKKCPKCNNEGMGFKSIQTRSADEGETQFYNCAKCGYSYKENS